MVELKYDSRYASITMYSFYIHFYFEFLNTEYKIALKVRKLQILADRCHVQIKSALVTLPQYIFVNIMLNACNADVQKSHTNIMYIIINIKQ
jgi:hypothetical protein